jgi:hypothetical protein
MRLGVVVVLRVPGGIVHHLTVRGVLVRRAGRGHLLTVRLANGGNVAETLSGGRLQVTLWRGRRLVGRLGTPPWEILPRSEALLELRCRPWLEGRLMARVTWQGRARVFRVHLG